METQTQHFKFMQDNNNALKSKQVLNLPKNASSGLPLQCIIAITDKSICLHFNINDVLFNFIVCSDAILLPHHAISPFGVDNLHKQVNIICSIERLKCSIQQCTIINWKFGKK